MTSRSLPLGRTATLADRYELAEGRVMLTGVQALVRVVLDQLRADQAAGLDGAAFVSGYPGSPLAGLDLELERQRRLCAELGLVHQPAVNEELAVTSVYGSQLVGSLPGARVEGVLGVWYGKAPGVDRAGDALRHANFMGAHPKGGMLALCGDDPQCKSSSVPSSSHATLAALGMPVFHPGSPDEILRLGQHAIAASRVSGLFVGMKVTTTVADAVGTVTVDAAPFTPTVPVVEYEGRPYRHQPSGRLVPPDSLEMERTLVGPRRELAVAYVRENGLNRVTHDAPDPQVGIVSSGSTYYETIEALRSLGLDSDELRRLGIRVLKLDVLWPLEPDSLRRFARGLHEIVVVEDKEPFVESALRDLLYGIADAPAILGKVDAGGTALLPAVGMLERDTIEAAIGARLLQRWSIPSARARLDQLRELEARSARTRIHVDAPIRAPCFCAGCPHNRSTDAPDDALVGAGIGCHGMVALQPEGKGDVRSVTQMGCEGAQWIGQAPFTDDPHLIQNMGDGTFSHSGSLAVRAAVQAGVTMTFKLLYNGFVAMTGGQTVQGAMGVPELARWLETEGVRRVVITTEDPKRYRRSRLPPIASVRPRTELTEAQAELRATPGVTVLIHDQVCTAEARRLRKRDKLPTRPYRVAINERVCEGCGDCGQKSHCVSLVPIETEFGRKTQVHQSSCNDDYSCLEGDCPSFIRVVPGGSRPTRAGDRSPDLDLPAPVLRGTEVTLRLIGIGGTGVVTVAQILAMAAVLDGKQTVGLDQTGLAQKGGQVVSDVRLVPAGGEFANRPPSGGVDGYIAFDLLGGVNPANLQMASPDRTVAVVSTSQVQVGSMVGKTQSRFPEVDRLLGAVEAATKQAENVCFDAQALSERLFGDHLPANTLVLGAAWQRGLIPISLDAIEETFRLNGVAVERNLAAFHWGRAVVARPEAVEALAEGEGEAPVTEGTAAHELIRGTGAQPGTTLWRLLETRVPDLVGYQNRRYAARYATFVAKVLEWERRLRSGEERAAEAVAVHLHGLMAYKDEYEVARLHLDPVERARIRDEFGDGAKITYLLQPPLLRGLGLQRKLAFGTWFDPVFRLLAAGRHLRGTPFDLFGMARVRRTERSLIREYRAAVEAALPKLGSDHEAVVALSEAPGEVRGYEGVKLRSVERYRARVAELTADLGGEPAHPGRRRRRGA